MKKMQIRALVAGCFACVLADTRAATVDESHFLDDLPVVLSASRLSQPIADAPAAVTVIDRAMILQSGARDLPDVFRLVPGFNVAYTRDNSWGVGYHGMADAFSRRMQVLIDGRSVYIPGFGQVPWNMLPLALEDIERIEIVRGPNAAAYGANAFMGVINIITRDPALTQGAHVSAYAGEQGMRDVTARYGGNAGGLRYRLTLAHRQRDRFENQAEKSGMNFLDFRSDYRLSDSTELTVNAALSRSDLRQGRSSDPTDPVRDDVTTGAEHFQIKYHKVIDPNTEWSLQYYHTRARVRDHYEVPLPVPVLDLNYGQSHWRDDLEFQMTLRPSSVTRLVWGAEARREGVEADGYFYGRNSLSGEMYRLFANLEWDPASDWLVNIGAMAEQHYYTGLDVSPRMAVNYRLAQGHTLRASIGSAYRSPTFFEVDGDVRFLDTNGNILGVRFVPAAGNLEPEKIVSREIGYIGQIPTLGLQVDARLFDDKLTSLLGTVNVLPKPDKAFQHQNLHHARIRGMDVQLNWKPRKDFDLTLSYARVAIRSDDSDIQDSAPENNLALLAAYRPGNGWEASLALYRTGEMNWLDDGNDVEAFTRVDIRLAKQLNWHGHEVQLMLAGQNIGGSQYQEFRRDNGFEPRVYAGLSFDW